MENFAFFHEDFYLQIELIPEENYFAAFNSIDSSLKLEDSEFGIKSIQSRTPQKVETRTRQIELLELKDLIKQYSSGYYTKVKKGYGNHTEVMKNTYSFEFERLNLFIETDSRKKIIHLWLCVNNNKGSNSIVDALHHISLKHKLIIIDWDEEIVVRSSNLLSLKSYLQEVFGIISITPNS